MASTDPSSTSSTRAPTPTTRFTSQASTAADLLASQTVGLLSSNDFRKRRAEALEQKSAGSFNRFAPVSSTPGSVVGATGSGPDSGAATPNTSTSINAAAAADGVSTPASAPPKKKRKAVGKGKLSFGVDGKEEEEEDIRSTVAEAGDTPRFATPETDGGDISGRASPAIQQGDVAIGTRKRLGPNTRVSVAPTAKTKSALLRDAQIREQLRKEFLSMQEAVKATEIIIPFVFYDGTNIPGGACKVKKGDPIWLFLDRSRKVGAELGISGSEKAKSRNEWARVGVDDLMLVRGEIIIPHHYEFYFFILNKSLGSRSTPLFDYSATAVQHPDRSTSSSPAAVSESCNALAHPDVKAKWVNNGQVSASERELEGADDDPNFTKVVDRRWYEKNKHIFPASMWEDFDPGKDYTKVVRKDAEGNAFFFS